MKRIVIFLLACGVSFSQGWSLLSNSTLSGGGVCPSQSPGGNGGCHSIVDAWSSAATDTTRNRLIIWGGGHVDYLGNEIYALYPFTGQTLPGTTTVNGNGVVCASNTSPSICRLNNYTLPNNNACYPSWSSSGCLGSYTEVIGTPSATQGAANAPNARHTYHSEAYDADDDIVLAFGGFPSVGSGWASGIWALKLSTLASSPNGAIWQQMDTTATVVGANGNPANAPSVYAFGALASPPTTLYDSVNKIFILTTTGGYIWTYKYTTNTITFISQAGGGSFKSGSSCVLYPPTSTMYCFGDDNEGTGSTTVGTSYIFSMSYSNLTGGTPSITNITSSTTACTAMSNNEFPGITYDSTNSVIRGWPDFGNIVYTFTPSTLTCTASTIGTTDGNVTTCPNTTSTADCPRDSNGGATTGTYGRFAYFASQNQFVLVNAGNSAAYTASISAPSCTITTASLPGVNTGVQYSQTVGTANCSSPSFSISVGSLPNGMSINSSTGVISGFAWASGTSSFTVAVADSNGNPTQALSIAVSNPSLPSTTNTITVTNTGSTSSNYPVQIGRAFVEGEITAANISNLQAWVGSTAVPTQVDSKNVWGDGSLKFAVVSFMIPTFTASTGYTITLGVGASVGNTALTQSQMLGSGFNFDATIQLTGTSRTSTASARTMLTNGDYTVWASGPIATTIILANHAQGYACVSGAASGAGTTSSKYDLGVADNFCPFRPEFEATFWPGPSATDQVWIRHIGEIANTQNLEDMTVSNIILAVGNTSPTTVYNYATSSGNSSLLIGNLTRWTMSGALGTYGVGYWINGTPPVAGTNHNLAYLASTTVFPNFNTSTNSIAGSQITSAYATFSGKPTKDLYDAADLTLAMRAAGARNYPADEIGPYTGPEVMWLYTGDYRAQQMAIRYAELSGAWPIHWREGNAGKFIDRSQSISGVGHFMSPSTRPTYCIGCGSTFFNSSGIATADKVTPVGSTSYGCASSSWCPNVAHEPDWTPVYLLTGDYYFLEENWAWASYTTLDVDGARHDYPGRGPTGVEGQIPGNAVWGEQPRGSGWGLRNRAEIAVASPDGTPEQALYKLLTLDMLAASEGERNITGNFQNDTTDCWTISSTTTCENAIWTWGNQFAASNYCTSNPSLVGLWCASPIAGVQLGVPSAIHFWVPESYPGGCNYPVVGWNNPTTPVGCTEHFMVHYVMYALGRAKDLGFAANPLLAWIGSYVINDVVSGPNPFLASSYGTVTVQSTGQYFTTYTDIQAQMCSSSTVGPCVTLGTSDDAQTWNGFEAPINRFSCSLEAAGDGNCSGAYQLGLAISQVADQTNGAAAWSWVNTNAMTNPALNVDPKWAIVPRSLGTAPPPSSITSGVTPIGVIINLR